MNLEYVHTNYSDETFNGANHAYKLDPSSNAIGIGIQYNFGSGSNSEFLG